MGRDESGKSRDESAARAAGYPSCFNDFATSNGVVAAMSAAVIEPAPSRELCLARTLGSPRPLSSQYLLAAAARREP